MICIVIDCKSGSRSTIEFEPLKPTRDNWMEVYGLEPVGCSLVEWEKDCSEIGEDIGLTSDRKRGIKVK